LNDGSEVIIRCAKTEGLGVKYSVKNIIRSAMLVSSIVMYY
jgi:hypothetical protein